jgi:iron(III) transport system substrate-binding protein
MNRCLPALLAAAAAGCGREGGEDLVVYAAVDEIAARPLFRAFTEETGIGVRAVFDTEEAKTLGLVHRLIAERSSPRADVFWSGEASRTVLLKERGLLAPHRPPAAADIPDCWKDPEGGWTGFGARARVIVYAPARVPEPPRTLDALADPRWKGRLAMAHPSFGTTAAHLSALALTRGGPATLHWLRALKRNGIRVVGGNSHVRDLVARGDCDAGLTDSDDVVSGRARGDAIEMVFPEDGALLIPASAALVRGAPREAAARRFLDWLLEARNEVLMREGPMRQIPLRPGLESPFPPFRTLDLDWSRFRADEAFLDEARKALEL